MSFNISIWRKGKENDPNGGQDPGVVAGKATIDTAAPTSTDANVEANVKRAFVLAHGEANVTCVTDPMLYMWRWDPDTETWIFHCPTTGHITVDDGQSEPLLIEVIVTV